MNDVSLRGKIRARQPVKYLVSGLPVLEFEITFPQEWRGKKTMGSMTAMMVGDEIDETARQMRIGHEVELTGTLWSRKYRARDGKQVAETWIICRNLKVLKQKEN